MKVLHILASGLGNIIEALSATEAINSLDNVEQLDVSVKCNWPGIETILPWNCINLDDKIISNYDVLALSWWTRNLQIPLVTDKESIEIIRPRLNIFEFSENDCNMDVAVQMGFSGTIPIPKLKKIDKKLIDDEYLVLSAGFQKATNYADWKNKAWPRWKEFAELAKDKGYKLATVGTEDECEDWHRELIDYDLCNKTDLAELVSVIQHAKAIVACDNGPAHIGDVCGIPTIALFGPTNILKNSYFKARIVFSPSHTVDCRPCQRDIKRMSTCSNNICMKLIEPKQVLSILENELEN